MPNSPLLVGAQTRLSLVREAAFNVIPEQPGVPDGPADGPHARDHAEVHAVEGDSLRWHGCESDPRRHRRHGEVRLRVLGRHRRRHHRGGAPHDEGRDAGDQQPDAHAEHRAVADATGVYTVGAGLGTPFLVGHLVKASGFANAANNALARLRRRQRARSRSARSRRRRKRPRRPVRGSRSSASAAPRRARSRRWSGRTRSRSRRSTPRRSASCRVCGSVCPASRGRSRTTISCASAARSRAPVRGRCRSTSCRPAGRPMPRARR
jgi:hypothetical protein